MTEKELRADAISEVAELVGTRPEWLDALINFETGGTYDPMKKNPVSSARGLIQIVDASAQDLGYRDSLEAVTKNPTFYSQLDNVVLPYLLRWKKKFGSLDTQQKLYMTVFYPVAVTWPEEKEFPVEVQKLNPGIKTPKDYISHVNRRLVVGNLTFPKATPILLIALAGIGVYFWMKSGRK
jgi:hypothetical protein